MTDKLTWSEFTEKYKPKDGDRFLDDRGNEWVYEKPYFKIRSMSFSQNSFLADNLTCPLIPPKAKRKMWPAVLKLANCYWASERLFESEEQARRNHGPQFHSWPAVPNADGSYEVDE